MKTITRLFLVGLIALGMTACSNEDEIKIEGQPDATVSIRVVPSSNGPVVRAPGDLSGALPAESAIKTLEVYLFNGEIPDGYGIATDALEVIGIATHSGTKAMVVVANASIGPVASKSALLEQTKNLPVDIGNGLVMTAEPVNIILLEGDNQYGFKSDDTSYKSAAQQLSANNRLPLTRVNARVAIVSANLGALPAGQAALFDALTDVQVAMFNVPQKTNLFGTALAINGDYLFGEAWPSALGSYTTGTANGAFLENAITFPITGAAAPYYYVNENTSETAKEQMMIVLRAKPMKGGTAVEAEGVYTDTDGYTYYPIWVNAAKTDYSYATGHTADSKILRNIQYNISLTIKGLGNPNIDPPVKSMLDVMVEVAPWLVVDQTVVWN